MGQFLKITKTIFVKIGNFIVINFLPIFLVIILSFRLLIFGLSAPKLTPGQRIRLSQCLFSPIYGNFQHQFFYHQIGFQKLKVVLPPSPQLNFGDCLETIGQIQPCSQPSRVDLCLLNSQISSFLPAGKNKSFKVVLLLKTRQFREKLINIFLRNLPYPEADLLAGIVLGAKRNFDPDFYQRLQLTGTLHIVVASGYNLSVIGQRPSELLAYFLGIRPALVLGFFLIWLYVLLAGGDPPVVRAAVMISFVLLGQFLGRRVDYWRAFFFGLWLMLMIDPSLLTSISFQLSVAALLGVSLAPKAFPTLSSYPFGRELAETISAQAWVLPLIALYFGRESLLAPLVNGLILPLIPWLMNLGLFALLTSLLGIGKLILWLFIYPFLFLIVRIIDFFSHFSWFQLQLRLPWWLLLPAYFFLALIFYLKIKSVQSQFSPKRNN